jgi:hypothetical protein
MLIYDVTLLATVITTRNSISLKTNRNAATLFPFGCVKLQNKALCSLNNRKFM